MIKETRNLIFLILGWISFILGVIGIILPIMPTTPFALLAAYFFSKGSPRLHAWLLRQPVMGPVILDWQKYGAVRLRVKITATFAMILLFGYALFFKDVIPFPLKIVMASIGIAILTFIWTRPDRPAQQQDELLSKDSLPN